MRGEGNGRREVVGDQGRVEVDDTLTDRAAVTRVPSDELNLVGIAVVGERRDGDQALDKLRLHP